MTVLEIQSALEAQGYDPGPLDGDMGPRTREAVRAFQADHGLHPDGIAGPLTQAALTADDGAGPEPLVTAAKVYAFAPNARPDIVTGLVDGAGMIAAAKITTPLRLRHFMAQIAVETGGLRSLEENLSYTAARLCVVWPSRFRTTGEAAPYARNPQALAEKVYGGRLGNTTPGDGWRYRGGGLIQTTGRANYRAAGFEDDPNALRSMPGALAAALVYWTMHGCNALADRDDITAVRKAVNGGTNGLPDAKLWLAKARKVWP